MMSNIYSQYGIHTGYRLAGAQQEEGEVELQIEIQCVNTLH